MLPIDIGDFTVSTPDEGWRDYYHKAWQDLCDKAVAAIDAGQFQNAFQAVRWIERSEVTDQPAADKGSRFPGGRPMMRDSSFRGNGCLVPRFSDPGYPALLADLMEHCGPFDAVVEIGSGWGRNLFDIFYHSAWPGPYFGGELTSGGRQLATRLSPLAGGMEVSFHAYDHTQPDLSFIGARQNVLVYSVHSLEQVAMLGDDFFDRLCSFAPKMTGVHIEPFGFQIEQPGPLTQQHAVVNRERGWNQDFAKTLHSAQDRGIVQIDSIAAEIFLSSDITNPSSFAMWTSA